MIYITVCYATPEKQIEIPLQIEESCTVELAIKRSKIQAIFPEIKFSNIKVGVNSKIIKLDANLEQNDRIEIYRKLLIDPKEARRLRAK